MPIVQLERLYISGRGAFQYATPNDFMLTDALGVQISDSAETSRFR